MKIIPKLFPVGHLITCVLFVVAAFVLLGLAAFELWEALAYGPRTTDDRTDAWVEYMENAGF